MSTSSIVVQRASQRFATDAGWLQSRHSFSFGDHYDASNVGHGLLLVNNDDIVRAGTGFGMHPHRDMEIVTWVLNGELEHRDSEGNHGVLYPGLAQRMSAGTGIRHSEMNPSPVQDVHFIQMWVRPDTMGIAPGYQQADVNAELGRGGLVTIASGRDDAAITIQQRNAVLYGAQLAPEASIEVPSDPCVHVYLAVGAATLSDGTTLDAGDALRLTNMSDLTITGTMQGTELLIWAMQQA